MIVDVLLWWSLAAVPGPLPAPPERVLRVCADPDNLPFSNRAGEGIENRLVELVARELGARIETTWWPQRRGHLRNTLNDGRCDVVPGIASSAGDIGTTRPWYRSTYVFATRTRDRLGGLTLDDPRLRGLALGVQLVGDDGANTPPAHSLSRRGLTGNVRGFPIYGEIARQPQAAIMQALARGDIDVALVWGPVGGYFANRVGTPVRVEPVQPWLDGPQWPMVYDVSMGVRKEDVALRRELDRALARLAPRIQSLLVEYAIPLAAEPGVAGATPQANVAPGAPVE
jgi:mxaJ protein